MAQTKEGAVKCAAAKLGISFNDYSARVAGGFKHCRVCREWKDESEFNIDRSRSGSRAALCRECQSKTAISRYVPSIPERYGPVPKPGRDGDKLQARARVNQLVKNGLLQNPNDVPCSECGHIGDDRRHEYHHHKGYSAEHHLSVIVLCSKHHARIDKNWINKTRNKKGQFNGTN